MADARTGLELLLHAPDKEVRAAPRSTRLYSVEGVRYRVYKKATLNPKPEGFRIQGLA